MADKKISELVNLTSLATDDEFVVVDKGANATKRITATNLSKFPAGVTVPDGGTIGSASDADAITIDATGNVALSQALQLGDSTAISSLGAEGYRITADVTSDGTITAWESIDEPTSATLGTGMSLASGVFKVPNAGIWLIVFFATYFRAGDTFGRVRINIDGEISAEMISEGTADSVGSTLAGFHIGSLTTSNDITFTASSLSASSYVRGDTGRTESSAFFLRLGDA